MERQPIERGVALDQRQVVQTERPSRHFPDPVAAIAGAAPAMALLRDLVRQVAPTESSVMITGETGSGKEVIARAIHESSLRRDRPFVAVNCGAIPADLLESELFGHEKGAFTGALTTRKGRFELAAGGTMFLDEIGDMPLDMQVKLLRVLQERRFERLGSAEPREADVRVIAATHRDLEAMIEQGSFREDLYYRLNVLPIEVPPLRERPEDIPLLIDVLNERLEARGLTAARFSHAALSVMTRYAWPGNVRELGNVVERCAILAPDRPVAPAELPVKIRGTAGIDAEQTPRCRPAASLDVSVLTAASLPPSGIELKRLLEATEERLIRQALTESHGVVARAADLLGLRRTTLVEKLRKFGIDRAEACSAADC